ncbi:MAG: hypothetical protein U0V72_00645 [Cytophagales bacterium]
MKNVQVISFTVAQRNAQQEVVVDLPVSAKKVKKIVITSRLLGNAMRCPKHYFAKKTAGVLPLVSEMYAKDYVTSYANYSLGAVSNTERIYYAKPASISGFPSFEVDGTILSFKNPVEQVMVDAETGYSETYLVYESFTGNFSNGVISVK